MMKFYRDRWYIGKNVSHRWGTSYVIFQGCPHNKSDYTVIEEFTSIAQAEALGRHWRKASRVVYEPLEKLIIGNVPVEKLISD